MILVYGKVTDINAPRVSVRLIGIEDDTKLSCLVLQAGGQTEKSRIWITPRKDDIVAVLFDENRPENSLILGGVYSDSQSVPEGNGVAIQTENVRIEASGDIEAIGAHVRAGKNLNDIAKASRADYVKYELDDIKSALDTIVNAFNSHTHGVSGTETTTPVYPTLNRYIVGDTGCNTVFIN